MLEKSPENHRTLSLATFSQATARDVGTVARQESGSPHNGELITQCGKGLCMKDATVQLGKRDQQIIELLLQGCDNGEIAKQLKMARRTVKARFNRLFIRFGITQGIKRVKLATMFYRRQLCLRANATARESLANESIESLNSLPTDSRIEKSLTPSAPPSTWSRTIFASSTTNSDSGTESNSPFGMKPGDTSKEPTPEIEAWDQTVLQLGLEGRTPMNKIMRLRSL
jgi:hypothetical protein